MVEHLLKRHSGFDGRQVDEWFCYVIMNCFGVCGMVALLQSMRPVNPIYFTDR